jgi:hypothetical protein
MVRNQQGFVGAPFAAEGMFAAGDTSHRDCTAGRFATHDAAAKADITRGRVEILGVTFSGAVAAAVVRRTKMPRPQ